MAYNKERKDYHKTQSYMDKPTYDNNTGAYEKKESEKVNDALSLKSLKGLPKSAVSVQADPYTASLPASAPYPVLMPFNRSAGGSYAGLRNLDGGNVQQYANSEKSGFLSYFDFIMFRLKINYQFIPTENEVSTHYAGKRLIEEQRRAIAEAVSTLQSTTFTQMAINNYVVETDMPMGEAKTTTIKFENKDHQVYASLTDVLYACLRYYQIFWQEVLLIFNTHNAFRLKQGTMIRSSWNRETPILNGFFGLMNKKSFLSLLDSISLAIMGEYVDVPFMEQINSVFQMPSRRSNAMTDPVLEIAPNLTHAGKFILYYKAGEEYIKVFDQDVDLKKQSGSVTRTFYDACANLAQLLTAEKTMAWARNENTVAAQSDNARFATIKENLDIVNLSITSFKTKFNDVREVLDTLSRTAIGPTWRTGFRPSIVKDTDAGLFRNLTMEDIYKLVFSGAAKVEMDESTKRWRTFALWDMYTGIPEYATYQGGAFLTFSCKTIDASADADNVMDYLPVGLVRFTGEDGYARAISRNGLEAKIGASDTTKMSNVMALNRLVPLQSQKNLEIRVPKVLYDATMTMSQRSTLYKTLIQTFGLGAISLSASTDDVGLDPDIVAIYQIEIEDITNEAITFARTVAPIKGATGDVNIIGFTQ